MHPQRAGRSIASVTAALATLQSSHSFVLKSAGPAFATRPMSTEMSSTATESSSTAATRHPLSPLKENFDHSWVRTLTPELESNRVKSSSYARGRDDGVSNNVSRPVFNGHYVPVKPTPLKNPRLVSHSPSVAKMLKLSEDDVHSEAFTRFFSGDVAGAFHPDDSSDAETWATPYALSIMGQRYTNNCPFGTGDGYGDGRAISVGEVLVDPTTGERYEMQLKGAGKTPFCRGADGRAVLRSSIREFLASEAMDGLGVSTTRALSLIVSDGPDGDTSQRPWYSERNQQRRLPSMDDPRLASYTPEQRREILAQLLVQQKSDPDVMIEERCAIATRVAPSFLRVGHIDLFARRVEATQTEEQRKAGEYDADTPQWKELEDLVWHACYREYPNEAYHPFREKNDIKSASLALLDLAMDRISTLVAEWVRVGFCQGNFNADNCLISGRTMDYGPFGFMDLYHPLFAKWTGSGDHFGFLNQPSAGYANFAVLVESVLPLIGGKGGNEDETRKQVLKKAQEMFQRKVDEMFRVKMGFDPNDGSADELWEELEPLLRRSRADWTVFWRQLSYVANEFPVAKPNPNYGDMLDRLVGSDEVRDGSSTFYDPLTDELHSKYLAWINKWHGMLVKSHGGKEGTAPGERMLSANPKYTLREWMLVEAYNKANVEGDESLIEELLSLVGHPYDEGTDEESSRFYRRAPDEALSAGGTAFMS